MMKTFSNSAHIFVGLFSWKYFSHKKNSTVCVLISTIIYEWLLPTSRKYELIYTHNYSGYQVGKSGQYEYWVGTHHASIGCRHGVEYKGGEKKKAVEGYSGVCPGFGGEVEFLS